MANTSGIGIGNRGTDREALPAGVFIRLGRTIQWWESWLAGCTEAPGSGYNVADTAVVAEWRRKMIYSK